MNIKSLSSDKPPFYLSPVAKAVREFLGQLQTNIDSQSTGSKCDAMPTVLTPSETSGSPPLPFKVTPYGTVCAITQEWVEKQGFFTDENDPETNMRRTRFPVMLTPAVFADCVEWRAEAASPVIKKEKENTRLWDLLWMCSMKVNETRKVAEVGYFFQLYRLPNGGVGEPPMRDEDCAVLLRAVYSVNDHGETILTVSLPEEVV